MSTEALSAPALRLDDPLEAPDRIGCQKSLEPRMEPTLPHSPPDSNKTEKSNASESELSDLEDEPVLQLLDNAKPADDDNNDDDEEEDEPSHLAKAHDDGKPQNDSKPQDQVEEEDVGEVEPEFWSDGVPVFKPSMRQFKDFQKFMAKVDSYGMRSGIIKIIPPKEWKDTQPELDDLIKGIRVREPIKQDIMGSNGTYRQVNILHNRSYDIPHWRQLCEQSEHQPPARRGERRANAVKAKANKPKLVDKSVAHPSGATKTAPVRASRGRPRGRRGRGRGRGGARGSRNQEGDDDRPMTPISPNPELDETRDDVVDSIENERTGSDDEEGETTPLARRMGGARGRGRGGGRGGQAQSISARRKYSKREGSAMIDEAAFKDFEYRMDISDYTAERCEELERIYWKTLTYAPPLYGADMMGTLFDDRTEIWNLNKLPNLLDVLGSKIPGVNTAYLYLGMWKATFAWHLEDVDLYSINYVHFGAPKQWYSISQADARRFEAAMKNIWPADAKACNQFLRHKSFLISPQHLLSNYGIKVNKVLSYPGEFVVTYPYGYHSGYNLGYNCAEAVNFALDPWLNMGKIAKKCECAQAQDSVWIDVHAIERKLRGEETEYEETEEESDGDEDDDDQLSGLPTPPANGVRFKNAGRKRKRGPASDAKIKLKKVKLRIKTRADSPCCLCPNDISGLELLATDCGRKAHRLCALHLPETYIDKVDDKEVVYNVGGIHKDRLDLKCLFCRSKKGACFQCSQQKCVRSYHPTCAAAAGVFVEDADVPVFGEDGTEYKEQAFEFSCRYHRTRRDRRHDADILEADDRIMRAARALQVGEICQMQYYRGDTFAGLVVENRAGDETILVDVIPSGDRIEVEWKWLLVADPADYHLPRASAKAIPLPESRKAKDRLNAKRHEDDRPRKGDFFVDGCTWAEFHHQAIQNTEQAQLDFAKANQLWHYLPKGSTDARAQYTENPSQARHNPQSNFLDTIPKPIKAAKPRPPQYMLSYGHSGNGYSYSAARPISVKSEKPYVYKPKMPSTLQHVSSSTCTTQHVAHALSNPASTFPVPTPSSSISFKQYFGPSGVHLTHGFPPNPQGNLPIARDSTERNSSTPVHSKHVSVVSNDAGMATPLAASKAAAPTPPKAPARLSWQIYPDAYQRYPFFQTHYNRDSARYRTPYALRGGFTNGYEGETRARVPSIQIPTRPSLDCSSTPGSSYTLTTPMATSANPQHLLSRAPATASSAFAAFAPTPYGTKMTAHPSIKARYMTGLKKGSLAMVKSSSAKVQNSSFPSHGSSGFVPAKQSPVPLPANFLAAMTSSAGSANLQAGHTPTRQGQSTLEQDLEPQHARSELPKEAASSGEVLPCIGGGAPPVQDFPDVPGSESMEFVERMMQNLRRASFRAEES